MEKCRPNLFLYTFNHCSYFDVKKKRRKKVAWRGRHVHAAYSGGKEEGWHGIEPGILLHIILVPGLCWTRPSMPAPGLHGPPALSHLFSAPLMAVEPGSPSVCARDMARGQRSAHVTVCLCRYFFFLSRTGLCQSVAIPEAMC